MSIMIDVTDELLENKKPEDNHTEKLSDVNTQHITICLVMIIKNEGPIMPRLLNSVKDIIDDIVISDTGSTDDTEEIVRKTALELGKPIFIDHTPFVNFGHNRTVAINVAKKESKSTFLLFLDADMTLVVGPKFDKQTSFQGGDVFTIMQKGSNIEYYNLRIARRTVEDLRYIGPTHEYCSYPSSAVSKQLPPDVLHIHDIGDGKCKDSKFKRDYTLLKQAIIDEPEFARYYFYLAETCRNMGSYDESIKYYDQRIKFGGWMEEVYMSYCGLIECYLSLGRVEKAEKAALESYLYNPARAEALYILCKHHRVKGNQQRSFLFYQLGSTIKYPSNDVLFVQSDIYHYLFEYEYSIIAYYLPSQLSSPQTRESVLRRVISLSCQMKHRPPADILQNVYNNMKFYISLLPNCFERREIPSAEIIGYHPSSTSVLRLGDNKICYFTRQVNYKIRPDGSYDYPGYVDTKSSMHIADEDGKIIREPVEVKFDRTCTLWDNGEDSYIRGVEDLRLFINTHGYDQNKTIYALGTTRQFSYDSGLNTMAICVFNIHEATVHSVRPLKRLQECEKNWAPIVGTDMCIYSWSPLRLFSFKSATHQDLPLITVMEQNELPEFFKHFRGSSTGVPQYDSRGQVKCYWFVVHIVYYDTPRTYAHILIKMSPEYKIIGVTIPFCFDEIRIEYCLGLLLSKYEYKLSYSVNDNCAREITIPEEWVQRNFIALGV